MNRKHWPASEFLSVVSLSAALLAGVMFANTTTTAIAQDEEPAKGEQPYQKHLVLHSVSTPPEPTPHRKHLELHSVSGPEPTLHRKHQVLHSVSGPLEPTVYFKGEPEDWCTFPTSFSDPTVESEESLPSFGQMPAPPDLNDPTKADIQPCSDSISSSFGASPGCSGSPGMLGDSYIRSIRLRFTSLAGVTETAIPSGGRYRFADHTSPIPQDRFFVNYHYFHNALQTQTQVNGIGQVIIQDSSGGVNTFVLGVEKTLFTPNFSIEFRLPFFKGSAQNDAPLGVAINTESPDVGNLSVTLKSLLYSGNGAVFSAGFGFDLPTAQSVNGSQDNRTNVNVYQFDNNAIYLNAFASVLYNPEGFRWIQAVGQYSTVLNDGNALVFPATIQVEEQGLIALGVNSGFWCYSNRTAQLLNGIALMAELNYTQSLQSGRDHRINLGGGNSVSIATGDISVINLTTGTQFQFGTSSQFRLSVVVPLQKPGSDPLVQIDRFFDFEVSAQYGYVF